MRLLVVFVSILLLCAGQVRAADADLSTDTKRMLAYGTLAVMTGACKSPMTAEQTKRMNEGLQKAASAQKQLSEDQFTEAMKAVGAQVGQNRNSVCASLTPEFIDSSLEEAAEGE